MRILLVVARLRDMNRGGGAIAVINDIQALCSKHDVHVVSIFEGGPRSKKVVESLQRQGVHIYSAGEDKGSHVRQELKEISDRISPDIVQVESITPAKTIGDPSFLGVPVILRAWDATWDVHSTVIRDLLPEPTSFLGGLADSFRLRRWLHVAKWWVRKRQEILLARSYNRVICFSTRDKKLFEAEGIETDVVGLFMKAQMVPHDPVPSSDYRVTYVGRYSYFPSADAAKYLLNGIAPFLPMGNGIKINIVGADPPSEVVRCHDGRRIVVHGFIQDIRSVFQETDVIAIPLRVGGGVKLKTMTALAFGIPVVSSPVAVDGLSVTDGTHLLVRERAAEFAAALLKLRRNPDFRRGLGEAGRRYIEEEHARERICAALESVYREVTQS